MGNGKGNGVMGSSQVNLGFHETLILFLELRIYLRQHRVIFADVLPPLIKHSQSIFLTPAAPPLIPSLLGRVGQTFGIVWAVSVLITFLVEGLR